LTAYNPLYSLAGFLVAMLIGMTGVGGGSMMTPVLVLLFNFHTATAVGTDLLFAAVTKTVGTAVHHRRGTVAWPIARKLALGSVPAALLTLWLMSGAGHLTASAAGPLNMLLGTALLLTSLAVFFRPRFAPCFDRGTDAAPTPTVRASTIAVGAALGVLVSVTSIGAGALGTAALLMLYTQLPPARIAATDIAHAVPLAAIAGIGHWLMGSADVSVTIALLAGSVPGVIVGTLIGSRVPEALLRRLLAVTLLIVAARMLSS
jgi:uncharacterized protein